MKKILKTLAGFALALTVLTVGQAHAVSLTLDPVDGAISGLPGDTVGWGFTLINDDAGYVVVSSTEFQPSTGLGTYTDFVGPRFLELAPGTSFTQAFDPVSQEGVGSFAIDPSASVGDLASGRILLTYDLFSMSTSDTNFDPDSLISSSSLLSAPASVQPVPEPGTLLLLGSGCAGLLGVRRRLRFG